MTQHFYSTQTRLADKIAHTYYGQYYVYVAEEFDPLNNDPASNPKVIRELWCRVSKGETNYGDVWFDHKEKLKFIALNHEHLSDELKAEIQLRITEAEAIDALPIVYIIPRDHIASERLRPGDSKTTYPNNIEHVIPNLRDSDDFVKDRTPCGENPDFDGK